MIVNILYPFATHSGDEQTQKLIDVLLVDSWEI
jgi:hypothetical protein